MNDVKKEVAQYIKVFDWVEVHQFGFLLLYLPVYLTLKELADLAGKNISYKTYGSKDNDTVYNLDSAASNSMKPERSETGEIAARVLSLGLSEVFECKGACVNRECDHHGVTSDVVAKLHRIPIVSRLPLWGVALANNTSVNTLLKAKDSKRAKYHEMFGPKLSCLDIEDLGKLKIGTYPKGSTSYRLITEGLSKDIADDQTTGDERDAYSKIRSGAYDVFVTIQPWLMAGYANSDLNIVIVYNHPTPPKDYTSLYVKHLEDLKENMLSEKFIKLLGILVWEKVAEIYSMERSAYVKLVRNYCDLKTTNKSSTDKCMCPQSSKYTRNFKACDFCDDPKSSALEILSDSRVYHFEPHADKYVKELGTKLCSDIDVWEKNEYLENGINELTGTNKKEILQKYFPHRWANNIGNIQTDPGEQERILNSDPLFLLSKYLQTELQDVTDIHHENAVGARDKSEIGKLLSMMGLTEDEVEGAFSMKKTVYDRQKSESPDINHDWRIDSGLNGSRLPTLYDRVMTSVKMKLHQNETNKCYIQKFYDPIFFSKKDKALRTTVLAEALHLFNSDILGKPWCTLKEVSCRRIYGNDKSALNILCVEYCVDDSAIGKAPAKFVKKNEIGKNVLNGWWIRADIKEPVPYFRQPFHGTLKKTMIENKINLELIWVDGSDAGEPIVIDGKNEAWLFTFRTYAD